MKAMNRDAREDALKLVTVKVAVLGYDALARAHALALRAAGNDVVVGLAPDTASSVSARTDGFAPEPAHLAAHGARVIVCTRDEAHPPFRDLALDPATLVVFGCGLGLEAHAGDLRRNDVVLVSHVDRACRVAVHRDTTGRALNRAIAYARAAFGAVSIEVSTVATEVDFELGGMTSAERPGGVLAMLGSELPELPEDQDPPEIARGERPSFVHRSRS